MVMGAMILSSTMSGMTGYVASRVTTVTVNGRLLGSGGKFGTLTEAVSLGGNCGPNKTEQWQEPFPAHFFL